MGQSQFTQGRLIKAAAGACLVAVVIWAHHFLPERTSALASQTIQSLHAPGFGLVSVLVLHLARFKGGPIARYLKAAAVTLLLAVIAEASQIPGGREAQFSDLVIDAFGIVGFLGCAAAFDRDVRRSIGIAGTLALAVVSIPAFVVAVLPTIQLSQALVMRPMLLPTLANFESNWQRIYVRGEEVDFEIIPAPAGWPAGSGRVAKAESSGRYAMYLRIAPFPDWRGYEAVSFVAATGDGQSRRIELGFWSFKPARDAQAGRYYTGVRIGPEPARYCVAFARLPDASSKRPFDVGAVSEMLVAAAKHETGLTVLLDDVRLEQSLDDCANK